MTTSASSRVGHITGSAKTAFWWLFGPEFCVVDEIGHLLTTVHNQNLLRRAKTLLDQCDALDWEVLVDGLWALRTKAETVTQTDYELAVSREFLYSVADETFDCSLQVGRLT